MKTINDVINSNVEVVNYQENFESILKIMKGKKIGRLPVEKNGKIIGVVTRDDLLIRKEKAPIPPVIAFWDLLLTLPSNKEFKAKLKKISAYTAEEIMNEKFLKIKENDRLETVVSKIIEENYSYALVFDNDNLKGIITKTDLIEKIF